MLNPASFSILVCCVALAGAPRAQLDAHAYTVDDRVRLERGTWLTPESVTRIEVGGAVDALEAWSGKQAWPLVKDPHKPVHLLVVGDKVRKAWREHGSLVVGYATQRDGGGELTLRASPRKLKIPADGVQLTLKQRSRANLGDSDGYLRLAIDDITDAQTLLSVTGADHKVFVERRSVRANDRLDIDLGDARYVLIVEQLRNLLIGDDYATLKLVSAECVEVDRIDALLKRVAAADVIFVREGKDYTGAEAAAHLRQKYEAAKAKVTTLDAFLTEIASRSSLTGNPYSIKFADGSSQSALDWLRVLVAEMERDAKARGQG